MERRAKRTGIHLALERRRGSILLQISVISGILVMLSVYSFRGVMFQSRMADRSYRYQQALAVAEAGIDRAIHRLNRDGGTGVSQLSETIVDHSGQTIGQFAVRVIDANGPAPIVESTGYIPSIRNPKLTRTVRVGLRRNGGPSFFDWAIYASGLLEFEETFFIDSWDSSDGLYENSAHSSRGNVGTRGDMLFDDEGRGAQTILGSLQAGGTISVEGGAFTQGGVNFEGEDNEMIQGNLPHSPPPFPEEKLQAARTENNNATGLSPETAYVAAELESAGRLRVRQNEELRMAPGTYYFSDFRVDQDASIVIDPPGRVTIYIEGELETKDRSVINENGVPSDFQIFQTPQQNGDRIRMKHTRFWGTIFAPEVYDVRLEASRSGQGRRPRMTEFYGALVVGGNGDDPLEFRNGIEFHYDQSLGRPGNDEGGFTVVSWAEVPSP